MPEEFKGKKVYPAFFTAATSEDRRYTTTRIYPQDIEYNVYRTGIFEQQIWKDWQAVTVGTNGFQYYNLSTPMI